MSYNQNLSISKSVPKESQQKKPQSSSSSSKPSHQENNNNNQQQTLKCPRCNSPNTKFCYYNNYSLSQPRHFCKTCRRYWTRGGALRNVPVGGGCRKTKKSLKTCTNSDYPISTGITTPCSSSSSRFFSVTEDPKFFNGLLMSNSPAIDFQLSSGFLNQADNLRLESSSSFGEPNCGSNLSLMGFNNFSFSNSGSVGTGNNISSMGFNGNITSSIETLSSLNQDLHLKLQQQRMAMIFGHQNQKETMDGPDQCVKPQPILFQNLETDSSRKEGSGDAVTAASAAAAAGGTEWLFGNIPTVQAWFQQ